MISYKSDKITENNLYKTANGWKSVDTIDFNRIANCISKFAWCPAVFKDGHRKESNFVTIRLLALDFETEELSLSAAVEHFKDWKHIIGTSRNHQIEKGGKILDRYRVVLIYSDQIRDLDAYKYNYKLILKQVPADRACSDGARFYFPCRDIISVRNEGAVIAVEDVPLIKPVNRWKNFYDAGIPNGYLMKLLQTPATEGGRNITAYKVARELCKTGYSEINAVNVIINKVYGYIVDDRTRSEIEKTVESAYKKNPD